MSLVLKEIIVDVLIFNWLHKLTLNTDGEQYDFSTLQSISHENTPDAMKKCQDVLEQSTQNAISPYYNDKFNQSSLECYFDDVELPWNTNGDKE
jgi:hypothetical protein